jgi:hypothetical protein
MNVKCLHNFGSRQRQLGQDKFLWGKNKGGSAPKGKVGGDWKHSKDNYQMPKAMQIKYTVQFVGEEEFI